MSSPKLNDKSEITISVVWLLQIISIVAFTTWGYARVNERIDENSQETKNLRSNQNNYVFPDIRKLEEDVIQLEKDVLILQTQQKDKK